MNKDALVDEIVEQLGIAPALAFTVEQAVYLAAVYGNARLITPFIEDQKDLRIVVPQGLAQIVDIAAEEVEAEFDIDVDAFNDYINEAQKLAVHPETHEKLVGLSVDELTGRILAKIGSYNADDVTRYVSAATLNPGYAVFNELFSVTVHDSLEEAVVNIVVAGEEEGESDTETLVVRLNADDFDALRGVRPLEAEEEEEAAEEE